MLDSTLPRQRLQLNIFEMRYRALVQRAMSAGRRFGMVGWRREGSHAEFGTEVEIVECEPTRSCHPLTAAIHIENATAAVADEEWPCRRSDGRYMIEVVGRRRFRLLPGTQTQAGPGYMVSELEFCSLPPPGGPPQGGAGAEPEAEDGSEPELERALAVAARLGRLVEEWEQQLVDGKWERFRGQLARIKADLGPIPAAADARGATER